MKSSGLPTRRSIHGLNQAGFARSSFGSANLNLAMGEHRCPTQSMSVRFAAELFRRGGLAGWGKRGRFGSFR